MPRKKIYLFIGVAIVVFLVARAGLKFKNRLHAFEQERERYTQRLHYDFSSILDTVVFLNGNAGPGNADKLSNLLEGRISDVLH